MDLPPQIVLQGLEGNDPVRLHGLQYVAFAHVDAIQAIWWIVFITTLSVMCWKLAKHIYQRE